MVFYTEENYKGEEFKFLDRKQYLDEQRDNKFSSFRLFGDETELVLFRDAYFKGDREEFDHSEAKLSNAELDNDVSSFVLKCKKDDSKEWTGYV